MSEENATIHFVVPDSMKKGLEDWAAAEQRSVSSLLRLLIGPRLDMWRREQERKAAAQKTVLRPRTSVAGASRVFEE